MEFGTLEEREQRATASMLEVTNDVRCKVDGPCWARVGQKMER